MHGTVSIATASQPPGTVSVPTGRSTEAVLAAADKQHRVEAKATYYPTDHALACPSSSLIGTEVLTSLGRFTLATPIPSLHSISPPACTLPLRTCISSCFVRRIGADEMAKHVRSGAVRLTQHILQLCTYIALGIR